jgi:hypothetical protein
MSFTLRTLTEGIKDRHVGQQNKRLVEKWSRTGLLRGMEETNRENMATLLENQAAQLLRESNTMGSGDVGGFTNIAFPIVRRVFGGLVANELVSIQPMSLPSGLLFYLDYTYGSDAGDGAYKTGDSIYGAPNGRDIQGGADAVGGQYDLVGSGFSRVHTTLAAANNKFRVDDGDPVNLSGQLHGKASLLKIVDAPSPEGVFAADSATGTAIDTTNRAHLDLIQHDSQIIDSIDNKQAQYSFVLLDLEKADFKGIDLSLATSISLGVIHEAGDADGDQGDEFTQLVDSSVQTGQSANVRRLTRVGRLDAQNKFVPDAQAKQGVAGSVVLLVVRGHDNTLGLVSRSADAKIDDSADLVRVSFVKADSATMGTSAAGGFGEVAGAPAFESNMVAGNPSPEIPEIDIKIESIPVTAQTRKLRARWSPELAQDLNAYHSMDAEVELTQILSEQIALEIDREILGDLLTGAKGANFFWSRSPGKFVNKRTGAEVARTSTLNPGPAFTGTVREWYETLTETVIDVANEIHRKTLRGSANFIVVSPDVATILEASVLYRPSYSLDGDGQVGAPFTMGAEKIGTLSNRFTVYKDPYFPRNKILVGYKGGSYLETGFVYAPYVPLIVTPTIFQPEDFTPRKGVMTRYGKKMVRADFYGTVTCLDMNII